MKKIVPFFIKSRPFSLFCIISLTIAYAPPLALQAQETGIKHDTVYIYDTVYEWVYDTIWVTDTTPKCQKNLKKISPQVPQHIFTPLFYYTQPTIINKKASYSSLSKKNKWNWGLRFHTNKKKNKPKLKKKKVTHAGKLTLKQTPGGFNPNILHLGAFSIDGYSGVFTHKLKLSDTNDSQLSKKTAEDTQPLMGYDVGMRLNYNLYQLGAQTGVGLSIMKEQFKYIHEQQLIDSTQEWDFFYSKKTFVDTISFLDLDALRNGDTVWVNYYDTTYRNVLDSADYYTYDTNYNYQARQQINKHVILEIPIIFTYEFGYDRASALLKIGAINQIHIVSTGSTYATLNSVENINNSMNFRFYNIALYGGLGFVYDFNRNWCLTLDMYYKHPLRSLNKNFVIKYNYYAYGANLGLRFRF